MTLNRAMKFILFILIGLILSLAITVILLKNSIKISADNLQNDIIPKHYDIEFIDHIDYLKCYTKIYFVLTQNRYEYSINIPMDHTIQISSVLLYYKQSLIPVNIEINNRQIIIKKHTWKKIFYQGNYTISINSHVNLKENFIHQTWSSKYRILFTKNDLFPYFHSSYHQPTVNMNIITADVIVSNLPLNETSSSLQISDVAFSLLHQYECRSMDILQLCFPMINSTNDIDLFSYIFNYTLTTIQIYKSYFSRKFPLDHLTIVAVLELNDRFISKPGLVFVDQNTLLVNTSAEEIIQQHELIYLLIAYQWINVLIRLNEDTTWFSPSLAKSIAYHLFYKIHDPNHMQIVRFMSTVVRDALCYENKPMEGSIEFENILISKGEAFLIEYQQYLGNNEFNSKIQQLIQYSDNNFALNESSLLSIFFSNLSSFLNWSKLSGHPIVFLNSSIIHMKLFKFNENCSLPVSSFHPITYSSINDSSYSILNSTETFSNSTKILIPLNPFIHFYNPSWNDEIKSIRYYHFNTFSKILFDSFLLNLANQISIKYPLQLINLFFQQSLTTITKNDLLVISKILKWYRSILSNSFEEKFINFLRKILNPSCSNQLWSQQIFADIKYSNQPSINDILLELCCSINHPVCLLHIPNRNDPQILLQFIFNNHRIDFSPSTISTDYQNQTDMLTSFNQLRIPSLFIYPDRITMNIVCQTVRQQNDKYWYDLITLLKEKFQFQPIPSSIITGLSCSIQTIEQIDIYLNHLCPSSPFKWPCYQNILMYSSMKSFDQLNTIDNEQWPVNNDDIIDFLFQISSLQVTLPSYSMIHEFQSLIFAWLTVNNYALLQWFDNENNQNSYLI